LQVAVAIRILKMAEGLPTPEERRKWFAYLCRMLDLPITMGAEGYREPSLVEMD
jgi:hypothetical protein